MTHPVLLNPHDHADLRIVTTRGPAWEPAVMSTLVVPAEFRSVAAHFPIVFQATADGAYQPVALFGLEEGQNLFLTPLGWDAHYLPLALEREPFMIGRQGDELVVTVDLDSPRISRTLGEAVFEPHGAPSAFTERINSVLLALHEGLQAVPALVQALLKHELLESFVLDLELDDGSSHRLAGYFTIDEARLAALDGAALQALHQAGHLEAAYMVLASQGQWRALIERRNALNPRIA